MSDSGHASPEAAALAEWNAYPAADARVVSVDYIDADHAVVLTDTNPSHPMWNYCFRKVDDWHFSSDHN